VGCPVLFLIVPTLRLALQLRRLAGFPSRQTPQQGVPFLSLDGWFSSIPLESAFPFSSTRRHTLSPLGIVEFETLYLGNQSPFCRREAILPILARGPSIFAPSGAPFQSGETAPFLCTHGDTSPLHFSGSSFSKLAGLFDRSRSLPRFDSATVKPLFALFLIFVDLPSVLPVHSFPPNRLPKQEGNPSLVSYIEPDRRRPLLEGRRPTSVTTITFCNRGLNSTVFLKTTQVAQSFYAFHRLRRLLYRTRPPT